MLRLAARPSLLSSSVRAAAAVTPKASKGSFILRDEQRWMSDFKADKQGGAKTEAADKTGQDATDASDPKAGGMSGEDENAVALAAAEARVAELEAEASEAKQKYMGVLAEMENVRRIAKNDVEKASTYAIQKFAKSLLPVSDNLGRALEAVPESSLSDAPAEFVSLHEGILMTEKDLMKVFSGNGIQKFGSVGDVFDPARYDAMFQYEDAEKEAGSVGQVIMHGYTFKDRVLRPCQVGVVKEHEA